MGILSDRRKHTAADIACRYKDRLRGNNIRDMNSRAVAGFIKAHMPEVKYGPSVERNVYSFATERVYWLEPT